jgi:hypothetical protein
VRYHLMRLLYIGWLAWLIYFPGAALMRALGGPGFLPSLPSIQRYAGGFLAGAGLWHVVLFGVGLAGGYHRGIAVALVLSVLTLSLPHLLYCLEECGQGLWRQRTFWRGDTKWALPLALILALAACFFLAVKGLYPAGGADYYCHYFHYYVRVIKEGSILPNEVWYQFYYSKGAGLHFLSMLLTDPLAPQLVTTAFIGCGALTVYTLLRGVGPSHLAPWIGATLYITFLIYTPGFEVNRGHGGWADLEKLHELTAVMVLGVVWLCTRVDLATGRARWAWLAAMALAIAATVLITTLMAALIGVFFALLTGWWVLRRQWARAAMAIVGGATATVVLVGVFTVNYLLTGLVLDQLILETWDYVDLERANRWGVLSEVFLLHHDMTSMVAHKVPLSADVWLFLFENMRLNFWLPLAAWGAVALAWFWGRRLWSRLQGQAPAAPRPEYRAAQVSLFFFLVMFCLMATLPSGPRSQTISFYRFSTFMYAPVLCFCLLPWCLIGPWSHGRALLLLLLVGSVLGRTALVEQAPPSMVESVVKHELYVALKQRRGDLKHILRNAWSFLKGRFSLKDAYQNQQGWPGRTDYGAIYPPMEKVQELLGPNIPVFALHTHAYNMLPDSDVRHFFSFRVPMEVCLLGTPQETRLAFQKEGINYFFVSKELSLLTRGIGGPFFAPETFHKNLEVVWSDGTSYLLTWPGPNTRPLDAAFLEWYAQKTGEVLPHTADLINKWKEVYAHMQLHGMKPFRVPWYRAGWDREQ